MKWSWGYRGSRNAPLIGDATARRCERVSRGGDTPLDPWFGCRVERDVSKPLRVIDRRYDLLALQWVRHPGRAMAGGIQRERAAGSLAKRFVLQNTACAPRYRHRLPCVRAGRAAVQPQRAEALTAMRTCWRRDCLSIFTLS